MTELTDDAFLGGRLNILQPSRGFRAAIDSVFLAAAVAAAPGQTVLELGSGVGTSSLCLARRVDRITITEVEIDSELSRLATENAQRNDLADRIACITGDAADLPADLRNRQFDHVFFNPPFHRRGAGTPSPEPAKDAANQANDGALARWLESAIRRLRPGGTVTLVHIPDALTEILAGLVGRAGRVLVFPLWPRVGHSASRILVSAEKGARAPMQLLPGMVLHGEGGKYTPEADNVLRGMHGIEMGI